MNMRNIFSMLKKSEADSQNANAPVLEQEMQEIENYSPINAKGKNGRTALINAVRVDNQEMVQNLLKIPNVNINLADDEGNTALHYAAKHASPVLAWLLDKGAELNRLNNRYETPLYLAIQNNQVCNAQLLVDRGADPNKGRLALQEVILKSDHDIDAVKQQPIVDISPDELPKPGELSNNQTQPNQNMMHILIEKLIDKNASLTARNTPNIHEPISFTYTALECAAEKGFVNLINLLKEKNVDFTQNSNAVCIAMLNHQPHAVKRLIELGCDPSVKVLETMWHEVKTSVGTSSKRIDDKSGVLQQGDTALHYAVRINDVELAKACLEKNKALVFNQNQKELTPPHLCIKLLNQTMAHILYSHGEDFLTAESTAQKGYSFREQRQRTLLMQATTKGFGSWKDVNEFFVNPSYELSSRQRQAVGHLNAKAKYTPLSNLTVIKNKKPTVKEAPIQFNKLNYRP